MKLYATAEFISNNILFEEKSKILTPTMKFCTTSIIKFDLKNFYS